MDASDFDRFLEEYHGALGALINGDPSVYLGLMSHSDDVTLANPFAPFGPVSRGRSQIVETVELAKKNYDGGELLGFDSFARFVSSDFAYIVEIERFKAKVGGATEAVPISLRVTTVLRVEDGAWKVVHRHADPIVSARPPSSVVATS